MRIISGSARGRKLKEPKGDSIRPTGSKVKEAVFSIIQFDIEGRRVLDLFAGTGQLGLEALSRGAAHADFADRDCAAAALVRENIKICGFEDRARVINKDYTYVLQRRDSAGDKYDIVFIDPPYNSGLAAAAITIITEFDKMNVNGIIICESKAGTQLPELKTPYVIAGQYKYGNVIINKIIRENK